MQTKTDRRASMKSRWHGMHHRCYSKKCYYFHRYGGRGIAVCERWHKRNPKGFDNFLEDMGFPKRGLSLDRIDNDGNYEPSNCRWATVAEQVANRDTSPIAIRKTPYVYPTSDLCILRITSVPESVAKRFRAAASKDKRSLSSWAYLKLMESLGKK